MKYDCSKQETKKKKSICRFTVMSLQLQWSWKYLLQVLKDSNSINNKWLLTICWYISSRTLIPLSFSIAIKAVQVNHMTWGKWWNITRGLEEHYKNKKAAEAQLYVVKMFLKRWFESTCKKTPPQTHCKRPQTHSFQQYYLFIQCQQQGRGFADKYENKGSALQLV